MLEEASKYFFVLENPASTGQGSIEAILLLSQLEKFVNGALEQIKRVERAQRSAICIARSEHRKFPKRAHPRMFMDAHFYFVCVGQVNKFLKQLAAFLGNPRVNKVQREFQKEFQIEIRNHLEHLDERTVGKIRGKRAAPQEIRAWRQDFVNFIGDKLSFGGQRYSVNADAAKKLKATYKKVIAIIREDYALKDKSFVNREAQEKYIGRVLRMVKKHYLRHMSIKNKPARSNVVV